MSFKNSLIALKPSSITVVSEKYWILTLGIDESSVLLCFAFSESAACRHHPRAPNSSPSVRAQIVERTVRSVEDTGAINSSTVALDGGR